nr:ROK family protein [Neobacillus sp. Marseille-Q6967]
MVTGDAAYIKKINRSLIISKIIEHGMISRAELAKITGLNKATVSVQAAELLAEELLIETHQEHKNLGRRPIMLSINQQAGYALGIDLDHKEVTFTLSDLKGCPLEIKKLELTTSDYNQIFELLALQIKDFQNQYSNTRYGVIGVVIGIHGVVNNTEEIYFVPHLQWRNKDLKEDLKNKTGLTVYIENNANLCSIAEKVYRHHQSESLLSVSLSSGIGLGFIVNGNMLKGYHGYAGEIGHMIVVPDGKPCRCGNMGCWEQYASEYSFFKHLNENERLSEKEIYSMMHSLKPAVTKHMEQFIKFLSIGLNNIINLYNPEVLVINSELLRLYPGALSKIKERITSTVGQYRDLVISEFGIKACSMGACALAIKHFLEVAELNLTLQQE